MAKRTPRSTPAKSVRAAPRGPRRLSLREALLELLEPAEHAELNGLKREAFQLYRSVTPSRKKQRYLDLCDKAWGLLLPHLSNGEYICTGCDPRQPFASPQAVPASRWANAKVNYEHWTAKIGDVEVIEIEISTAGGLHISKRFDQVRLGKFTFRLGAYLPLFVTLATGARALRQLEPLDELRDKHFPGDDTALGLGIFRIKQQMSRAGMDDQTVDFLITNVPRAGYRLNMRPAEIAIED